MSAFIVDDSTINRIVSFVASWEGRSWYQSQFKKAGVDANEPTEFGQALAQMNQDAVNQRYQEEPTELTYQHKYVQANKVAVYKAIQCLSYQCAEGNVPERELYKLLESMGIWVAGEIIRELPEYEQATWG